MLRHYTVRRTLRSDCSQRGRLTPTGFQLKWMNTANFAIATVVDLVLTGAFVTIMRQKRTGFLRYVHFDRISSSTRHAFHGEQQTDACGVEPTLH